MSGSLLLALQFGLLLLLLWPWRALTWPMSGMLLIILGIVMMLWALKENRPGNFNLRPQLKPEAVFITSGPYAHVRHPMYSALLLAGLGLAVMYADLAKLLCWLLLWAVLRAKAAIEEREMALRFPGYRDYASMTGRFFPRILLG